MAIKFPLEMRNGVQVRNITELRENFDAEKVVGYFLEGKLKTWLDARYYEDEAGAVACLSKDDPNLAQKLCQIFGIEYVGSTEINPEEIAEKTARINRLKQYTDDDEIIQDVDMVAFDQEELAELYDRGVEKIYLCEGEFVIPGSKQDLEYILLGDIDVVGLPPEEHNEEDDLHNQYIEMTEPIVMNSTQSQKFQDAIIQISSTIKCNGTLEFENCEIYCSKTAGSSFHVSTRSTIDVVSGCLRFKNCKIKYDCPDSTYRTWFITGENANIIFEACSFVGCNNLVGTNKGGNISFISCTTPDIKTPMVTGHGVKKIQISNCSMIHNSAPIAPEELDIHMKDALFNTAADAISISQSTFEGFTKGIVSGNIEVTIDSCTFIECSAIVCGRENRAQIESCGFEKCIHLFKNEVLSLTKCNFSDCYGKIETEKLSCESCNWNAGFVLFTQLASGGKSTFARCSFENIQYQNAFDSLCKCAANGYKYFSFGTDGEIEELLFRGELIHTGNTGKISACKFINMNLGKVRFLISCESFTSLDKCTFENCITGKDILDRTEYTHYDLTKPALFTMFDKGKKRQASYYISNCNGIRE